MAIGSFIFSPALKAVEGEVGSNNEVKVVEDQLYFIS